ncbi:MAG: SpoIIIAH-like family protein [Clostridia bacterium]|nr:SpoIIIAH-like family protein [Clostridia bacterium]
MKSRIIGRRQLLTFSLVFALSLAVFVNWYYTKPQNEISEPEIESEANLGDAQYVNSDSLDNKNYFEMAEINRKKAHDTAKELLSSIIADTSIDEETKISAREKLTKISEQIKTESDIENLISAQINSSCIVTYGEDSIEVLLSKDVINNDIVVKIKDIIVSKTKLTTDKITIIETK